MHTKEKVAVLLTSLTLLLPMVAYATTPISLTDPSWTVYNRVWTNGSFHTKTSSPSMQTPSLLQFPFPDSGPPVICAPAGSSCAAPAGDAFTGFLLDKISLSLTTSNTITAKFSVPSTAGTPTFVGNPDGYVCGTATSVRLFFQSTGSGNPGDLTGGNPGGAFETNYWWSNTVIAATAATMGSHYNFATGGTPSTITILVPLTGADWSDFYGHFGTSDGLPTGTPNTGSYGTNFVAALGDIQYIGLSFGSGCFFANGVGVDYTTGNANFLLMSYAISP